jgi:hypothetical protein
VKYGQRRFPNLLNVDLFHEIIITSPMFSENNAINKLEPENSAFGNCKKHFF